MRIVVALELLALLLAAAAAGLSAAGAVAQLVALLAAGAGLGVSAVVVALGAVRAEQRTGGTDGAAVRTAEPRR